MKPKILIIGAVPYNKKLTSRAFDAYFSNWEKENLAQIFSHPKKPVKGHCGTLYQITDQRLILRRIKKSVETGIIFKYDELPDEWAENSLEVNSTLFSKLYQFGRKKTSINYLIRKFVWKKKYWCTQHLNNWLDEFKPDCIFLCISDHFYMQEIALYVANRFNIPIVSCVWDDYYFNSKKTISPFYLIYKNAYRKQLNKVFEHKGDVIYISDKMKDKYNSYFGLNGKTVYLTSTIQPRNFKEINKDKLEIAYFGNISLGRNYSLNDIGYALGDINPNYILHIYSNEINEKFYKLFFKNQNIKFHGSVPYNETQKKINESDIIVIVEGFDKKYLNFTKYSLSTKVADYLASGTNIFAYGPIDSGTIEYLYKNECAEVCLSKENLKECFQNYINNQEKQRLNYKNAIEIANKNHSIKKSTEIIEKIITEIVK